MESTNEREKLTCKFFIIPGNGTASLIIPDIEIINLLNSISNTIHVQQIYREINVQRWKRNATQTENSNPYPTHSNIK